MMDDSDICPTTQKRSWGRYDGSRTSAMAVTRKTGNVTGRNTHRRISFRNLNISPLSGCKLFGVTIVKSTHEICRTA